MNEQRIREIAGQCSDFAEQIPFYRGVEDGLTWEAKIQKARDLKFAELIVRECIEKIEFQYGGGNLMEDGETHNPEWDNAIECVSAMIKQHFGVEE